jgi:hypothetical protein
MKILVQELVFIEAAPSTPPSIFRFVSAESLQLERVLGQ